MMFNLGMGSLPIYSEEPTDNQIEELLQTNPSVVYDMIRKLYVIEHAEPKVTLPMLRLFLLENGDLIVDWDGPAEIIIGEDPKNLYYTFEMKSGTMYGFKPQKKTPWGWIIGGSAAAVAIIFGTGVYVGATLAR